MTSHTEPQSVPAPTTSVPATGVRPVRLRFQGGQHHGKVVRIKSAKCTIGSAANATLRLACEGIHPIHCLLLNGTNGSAVRSLAPNTLLNGEPFEDSQLHVGDVLTLGPLQLIVVDEVTASPGAPASAETSGQEPESKLAVIATLSEKLEATEAANQKLQQQLDDLTARGETEASQHQHELQRVVSELDALREQVAHIESLTVENQQLVQQVNDLQNQLHESQELQSQQQSELVSTSEQLSELEAVQNANEELIREVDSLQEKVDQAESYCQQWESQQDQLQNELATLRTLNAEQESELGVLRERLAESSLEEPIVEEATVEEATVEEATVEEATVEEATAEEPTAEEPTAEEPTAEEPTAEEPTAEEATALESPAAPAAHEHVHEPVSDATIMMPSESLDAESPRTPLEAIMMAAQDSPFADGATIMMPTSDEASNVPQEDLALGEVPTDYEESSPAATVDPYDSELEASPAAEPAPLPYDDPYATETQATDGASLPQETEQDMQDAVDPYAVGPEEYAEASLQQEAEQDAHQTVDPYAAGPEDYAEAIRQQEAEQDAQQTVDPYAAGPEEYAEAILQQEAEQDAQQTVDPYAAGPEEYAEAIRQQEAEQDAQQTIDPYAAGPEEYAEAGQHQEVESADQHYEGLEETELGYPQETAPAGANEYEVAYEEPAADDAAEVEYQAGFVGQDSPATTAEEGHDSPFTPVSDETYDPDAMLNKLRSELRQETVEPPDEAATAYDQNEDLAQEQPFDVEAAPTAADGPQSMEDIEYSQPTSSAPVDTASILAKFGHSMDAEDSGEEFSEPPQPPAPSPTPPPLVNDDDDASIQDYMAQLMQRVGGGSAAPEPVATKPAATKPAATQPTPPPQTERPAAPEPAPKPLDPSEFVPRAIAPEATSGLKALRAVANTSTRSAIHRHQRRSMDTKAILCLAVGLVSFAVCVATGYLALGANNLVSVPTLISLATGFVGVLASLKALAYSARSAMSNRRQQNLKQLSSR